MDKSLIGRVVHFLEWYSVYIAPGLLILFVFLLMLLAGR